MHGCTCARPLDMADKAFTNLLTYHGMLAKRRGGAGISHAHHFLDAISCLVSLWIFLGFEASGRLCRMLAARPPPASQCPLNIAGAQRASVEGAMRAAVITQPLAPWLDTEQSLECARCTFGSRGSTRLERR